MANEVPPALSEQTSKAQTQHRVADTLNSRNAPSSLSSKENQTAETNDFLNHTPPFHKPSYEPQQFRFFIFLCRLRQNIKEYSHVQPIIGLFVFYIGHDALQERMFRFDGFKFGFFMTLVEVIVMLVGSLTGRSWNDGLKMILSWFWIENDATKSEKVISEGGNTTVIQEGNSQYDASNSTNFREGRTNCLSKHDILGSTLSIPVLIRIAWVGLFLALAHGLGNTALRYSPYPLKVAFKSCKLVPTMALGACVTGRKHTALQYTAAFVMGLGLAVLTAADVFTGATNNLRRLTLHNKNNQLHLPMLQHHYQQQQQTVGGIDESDNLLGGMILRPLLGPTLLLISTFFDSVVPNLQEQLLQTAKVKTSEMIFVSNTVMCVVLVTYTVFSGELTSALSYCWNHREASLVLYLQGLCAYWGLQCYLAIIRDHGGVVGVLLANARKIITIILSFLLFSKPFNARHFVGLVLVFVGVYLGYLSKREVKVSLESNKGSVKPSSAEKRRKMKVYTEGSHEHSV
mmetsp:Transcript_9977/g.21326  ORF Transcript_9977/g.21326 Transcript_9977/m.21326 type:complete len:516 (+) Transcript_9977:198-1745(+)